MNIKLKVPTRVLKLIKFFPKLNIIALVVLLLLGYYPTLSIPPIRQRVALAQETEQTGEVIAIAFHTPIIFPHPGYLSTKFSNYHPGVDIASGLGIPIHPIIDGEVVGVGRDIFGLGNYVVITHESDFKSKYAHMGRVFVKMGQKVSSENIIGEVGLTGHTSGPHTHLEITHNGNYIDPQTILPELPPMPPAVFAKK